jgi:hypothetical protein
MAPNASIKVNRAPVLTLWASVVAERLGHPPELALSLAKIVAGTAARAKARRLGIAEESDQAKDRHNAGPATNTAPSCRHRARAAWKPGRRSSLPLAMSENSATRVQLCEATKAWTEACCTSSPSPLCPYSAVDTR